ncbi:MAG: FAD-dependent oxidoreductase [Deltaproteobacteria bacterium]|nr:FAD-dependent oxidoreductase [Deltaproteobacteria bacterium]MBW1948105.1 FAD-dependent oxidoreductase [Deltaproteobacteria bacterium]MBW2006530.1 FAD-dependent oxidoreductase [Deltaproteobacteria bacterium]
MKRPKNRLHRVLVVGATPAGIAAVSKLGELGIPVTLTDPEPDLDRKLAREEWRLASGLSLNFAQRSALLRILRNPDIRTLLPARVTKLKHTPQGFRAHLELEPTYVDPDRCTLCGKCVEACPVHTPDGTRPIISNGRRSLPGRPVIDKRRKPPCQESCPLGVNAQAYIALARAGRYREALEVVRRDNVLPGICGRVCTHPCEDACRRGELDDPVAIRHIKRFLADYELEHPPAVETSPSPRREGKIAVVGSGPAGLAAAADLARLGYEVEVYEKEERAGGLLRYGIGKHRLPREILEVELAHIEGLGVKFLLGQPVDFQGGLQELRDRYDAVVLATGTWEDRPLGVPGEELEGVEGCLSLLQRLYREEVERIEEEVAVIGDGNAAFDLARSVRRMGARVTILSWFPEDLIPADEEELRGAREEGIRIVDRTQVVAFLGRDGRLERLRCTPTEPGPPDENGIPWPVKVQGARPFELAFDRALVAIGQKGPYDRSSGNLSVTTRGLIAVDEEMSAGPPGVFAAGDATRGPSSVVEAMASGRATALAVHRSLAGDEPAESTPLRPKDRDFSEIPPDIPSLHRPTMPERQPGARCDNFSEVALGLSESQVLQEAERCLQCGLCAECLLCAEVCGPVGAINHAEDTVHTAEHAGVVIIADPHAVPPVKGEDVIRAYGPKAAKPDVYAMICRGYAAAAQAMVLLSGTSVRPKGRGFSFSPPDPHLSPEIRVGVFVCRCNDSLGWSEEMESYVLGLEGRDDVVHSQILSAACVPEGYSAILRAVREKGLTRLVLASCVCCPLDFVCSACTDQRSRLKEGLFRGTGISRSMVETCNVRGEALRLLGTDPDAAHNRFQGLIERSVNRARRLKPLPTPARIYNFTTAVVGESESALTCALTLAEAGLEVFLFGSPGNRRNQGLSHPNILLFRDATVKGLSGTLGDFQVFIDSNGRAQTLQVGAVIVGERFRRKIPYYPQEGLKGSAVNAAMQKKGVTGVPFLTPGATSISGLFLAAPPDLPVSERKKGAAAAVLAAAVMPRGPRQSKGYTVVVNEAVCRGCGRCFNVCPYQAITFERNAVGGWHAVVDEALCKGCGNCISVCPSNAADSPYRDQAYLEQLLEEVLAS